MANDYWYRRVWKVLDAKGESGLIIQADNEFWLEPQRVNGSVDPVYYEVKFEPGKLDDVWEGTRLFPLGVANPTLAQKLPPFSSTSKKKYMDTALNTATGATGLTVRLEGVLKKAPEVACFYVFPDATNAGRDWLVIDVKDGTTMKQDGTAHGDPK